MDPMRLTRPAARLALLLILATALAACTAAGPDPSSTSTAAAPALPDDRGDTAGGEGNGGSDEGSGSAPGGSPKEPVGGVPAPGDAQQSPSGALVVQPEPGIVNAIPHAWDHVSVAADGRTITVFYWGGVQDCYGLAGVEVERDANGLLQVTVMEGQRGNLAPNTACDEIALLKSVTVAVDDGIFAPADGLD